MPTVRTTIQPGVEIEVSDAEAAQLAGQGLLYVEPTSTEPTPEPARRPSRQTASEQSQG